MADAWKNYTMVILTALMLAAVGLNAQPEATHYCDSRHLQANCFDVSSTGKTCYTLPAKTGGKLCDESWKKIPPPEISTKECPKVNIVSYTDNGKWFCDKIGIDANCVRNENLEMPFLG